MVYIDSGKVNVGDQLLVCDGVSLLDVTHDEAAQALKRAMDMESVYMILIYLYLGDKVNGRSCMQLPAGISFCVTYTWVTGLDSYLSSVHASVLYICNSYSIVSLVSVHNNVSVVSTCM